MEKSRSTPYLKANWPRGQRIRNREPRQIRRYLIVSKEAHMSLEKNIRTNGGEERDEISGFRILERVMA